MKEGIHKLLALITKGENGSIDFEKIRKFAPEILRDWKDINDFLYSLPEVDYDIEALETALLAVDGAVSKGRKGNGLAKAVLFHLYHDGEYEILIHDRVIKIDAPELKSRERYNAFLASDCPDHYMHVGDMDIIPEVNVLSVYDYAMLYLFGTNFGFDVYDYPVERVDDSSAKDFERAIGYLPTLVGYLTREVKIPDCGMKRILRKMEREGYSGDEVARFCCAWVDEIDRPGFDESEKRSDEVEEFDIDF